MTRLQRLEKGVTLPELITVMLLIGLLLASVVSIYGAALRTYLRGNNAQQAEAQASWTMRRMSPDLRQAMMASPSGAPYNGVYLTLAMPSKAWNSGAGTYYNQIATNAQGLPYLVQGRTVYYYRGDSAHSVSNSGDRVWRAEVMGDGSINYQQLTSGVVNNPIDPTTGQPRPLFLYWPSPDRLKSVLVTITVLSGQGPRSATVTKVGEFSVRNQ